MEPKAECWVGGKDDPSPGGTARFWAGLQMRPFDVLEGQGFSRAVEAPPKVGFSP